MRPVFLSFGIYTAAEVCSLLGSDKDYHTIGFRRTCPPLSIIDEHMVGCTIWKTNCWILGSISTVINTMEKHSEQWLGQEMSILISPSSVVHLYCFKLNLGTYFMPDKGTTPSCRLLPPPHSCPTIMYKNNFTSYKAGVSFVKLAVRLHQCLSTQEFLAIGLHQTCTPFFR